MKTTCPEFRVLLVVLAWCGLAAAEPPRPEVPFQILRGHLIVVKGSVQGVAEVDMMIDTGSTVTVIDRRLVQRLGLTKLPQQTRVRNTTGRQHVAEMVVVPGITIGPIVTSRACLVGDLPIHNIDMIVGLDILRKTNFSVDLVSRKLVFTDSEHLPSATSFDASSALIVVPVQIGQRPLRLIVDTGAKHVSVYHTKVSAWIGGSRLDTPINTVQLSGTEQGREVHVNEFRLDGLVWDTLKVLVLKDQVGASATAWDGVLSPVALGLSRIHFDFRQGVVSLMRDR